MILTTTPAVEGRTISEYRGVVFGEVITGVNFLKDFAASIRNIIGGRSGSYEEELRRRHAHGHRLRQGLSSHVGHEAAPLQVLATPDVELRPMAAGATG